MMDNKYRQFSFIELLLICVALVTLIYHLPALASGDKITQSNDNNTQTGGDIGIKGDTSKALGLGLSYGMGDVDINEGQNCMGSEQRAHIFAGRQDIVLNPWCAALFYDLNGKHTFAAKMRCDIPEIGGHYTTAAECVLDQDLSPTKPDKPITDAIYEEHQEDIEVVQMAQMNLEDRIEALEKKPAPKPRMKQAAPEPEPLLTEQEKLDILGLLLAGNGDDDE